MTDFFTAQLQSSKRLQSEYVLKKDTRMQITIQKQNRLLWMALKVEINYDKTQLEKHFFLAKSVKWL